MKNQKGDFVFIAYTVIIYAMGILLISLFSGGIFK